MNVPSIYGTPTERIMIYRDRRYAGIMWHVGARTFHTLKRAMGYKCFTDELRVSVNGLRWKWESDSVNHPSTAVIFR